MASWRLYSKVLSLNKSVDLIKVLARTFNSSYHHCSIPPAPPAYWPEHYYPDPVHYQHNPSFVNFQSMFHAHHHHHHQCVRPEGYFNEYYWVNGDPRWNQKTLNAYVQPHMSVFHPIFSSGDWNFSPHFYPYRPDVGYVFNGGGEQPVYPSLICGQYPQTCYNGHLNNYGTQWNQQLQDVYGYDQYYKPKWTTDYNYNIAARFQGHEFSNKYYPENSTASQPKSAMSYVGDRYVNPNVEQSLHGNGSRYLTPVYEGYQWNSDEIRRRNFNDQPQIPTHYSPNTSFSDNDNGFRKHLTEAGYNLNGSSVGGQQQYPHNTNCRRGGSRGRPEVKKNNTVNFDWKKNWEGDKWRDDNDQPQNVTVKEQPAKVAYMRGQLHQSPETYQPATNGTARDSRRPLGIQNTNSKEKHHPRDTSNRCTQEIYGNHHSAEPQNPDSGFPSPNLNASGSDEGHQVLNCKNPVENIKPEKIIGTAVELQSFTKDGKLKLAVKVLDVMEKKNEHLDPELHMSTVKMLIRACGDSKAITEAKAVHKHLITLMSPLKFSLYNKILGMYLKCGAVADAFSMFYSMSAHNLTSWDTMIKGLVRNNLGEEALDLFAEFKKTGLEPDGSMFLGVFAACRHVGDVIEGMLHFESMTKRYGITPSMKHYISIVDMMGHVGHLDEAMEFIEKMPVEPSVDVWETMMTVCRIQGNLELVDRCAEAVQELDPTRFSEEMKAALFHW